MGGVQATELMEWGGVRPLNSGDSPAPRFVVISSFDGFPGAAADRATLQETPGDVLTGAAILRQAAGADEVHVLVAESEAAALEEHRAAHPDVGLLTAPPLHPLSSPRVMASWLAEHSRFAGSSPTDFGIHEAAESVAAAHASRGRMCLERWVTVTGAVHHPGTFLVPHGTTIATLLRLAGGRLNDGVRPWRAGRGELTPVALSHGIDRHDAMVLAFPATASLSRNEALSLDDSLRRINSVCTRCALCDHACPVGTGATGTGLAGGFRGPLATLDALRWSTDTDGPVSPHDITQCVDCRLCDTVCPTGLPVGRVAGELARRLRGQGVVAGELHRSRLIPKDAMRHRLGLAPAPEARRDARDEVRRVRLSVKRDTLLRASGEHVWRGDVLARRAHGGGRILAPLTGRLTWAADVATIRRDRSSQ